MLLSIVFGFILPAIQYEDYSLNNCICLENYIVAIQDGYEGFALLNFRRISKSLRVITNPSSTFVRAFLNLNYRVNSTVLCYTSVSDIETSLFTNNVALGFTIFLGGSGIIVLGIFLILVLRDKYRRREYEDLDMKIVRSERVPPPL